MKKFDPTVTRNDFGDGWIDMVLTSCYPYELKMRVNIDTFAVRFALYHLDIEAQSNFGDIDEALAAYNAAARDYQKMRSKAQ